MIEAFLLTSPEKMLRYGWTKIYEKVNLMITIKDVAKEAGVSTGTVSNVLNGKPGVKEENITRVLEVIKKLDYNTNMIARALRTKVSESIGLIVPSITNPYYPEFVRGVEDQADKDDLTVFICNSDRDKKKEIRYINSFMTKSVDGFIIMNPHLSLIELNELKNKKFVIVGIDDNIDFKLNIVNASATVATLQGMELLYSYRHNKIGFLTGIGDTFADINKLKAYNYFIESKNIIKDDQYIYRGNYTWESGYKGGKRLLTLENRPTAIFAANDLMALGALQAARDLGYSVPKDVSILGFDDIEMSRYSDPPLTTIQQPKYELGVEAVKMLIQIMNTNNHVEGMRKTLHTEIVMRESVKYK